MDINLEYYKIFYMVGKYKSITLAAEELSISQPAVSQSIKNLEKALGSELFVRTSKGVRLTSEGEVLYSYVARGYETILQGEKKFLEMQDLERGEICIGASDMTLKFYLLEYLEKFHEAYPNIKVTVTNAPTPETLRYLRAGKIDFGVVSTPVQLKNDLELVPVREIEDIFVASDKFEQLKERIIPLKELETLPVMCLEGSTSTRSYVDYFLHKKGVHMEAEFELATSDMLVEFARKGLGVASVVADFAKEYLENKELFQLNMEEMIPKRKICIVTDKKIPISAAAGRMLQILEVVKHA